MGAIGRWLARREAAFSAWENAKPGRAGRACYHVYSCVFVVAAILVLIGLPLNGRGLIWNVDGMGQYYPFFIYEGQWIRGVVSGLVSGNGLNIPLWEWNSGYGADIPTTFDVFFDPLNLVSAITPEAASEWVFQLLVLVRLYLAGLAFVFYCRTRGENRTGTVLGALLYALCGAGLTVVRWSSGLHALILFPVILAGAERVLEGRKPWVFVASLTLLAIVSYYFTYMACFLLVGYLAVRVVMVERPHLNARIFLRWVAVFAGLVVLCLVLAGFALVPAVFAVMGMDRVVDQETVDLLLYAPGYYLNLLTGFLSTSEVGSDTFQGFGGLAFFACVALFLDRGKNKELKLVFIVLSAFFLFPAVGSFFNGMNYATNRWAWAYAMCVAFVLVRVTPKLLALGDSDKRVMAASALAYAVLLIVPAVRTEANVAGFAALLAVLVILVLFAGSPVRRSALCCALVATLAVNGLYFLSASEGGKAIEQSPLFSSYDKLTASSVAGLAASADDGSWYRYDAGEVQIAARTPMNRLRNNSLVQGVSGIDFYNSIYDNNVDAFHTELAIAGDSINFSYLNLQGRSDLMALLGVKYYAFRNDGTDEAPYNYSLENEVLQRDLMGVDYRLLRADRSLPVGYVFEEALGREDYLALAPLQRQQALLQAVVLEGDASWGAGRKGARSVDAKALEYEDIPLAYSLSGANGVELRDGGLLVAFPGASVTLSFEGKPDSSSYVYFHGLKYRPVKPSELANPDDLEGKPWYYRVNAWAQDLAYTTPLRYELALKSDVSPSTAYITNSVSTSHMYGGKDTWLANLGYAEEPAQAVTITFDTAGIYEFSEMSVHAQSHEKFAGWMSDRSMKTLENAKLGCNELSGTVSLEKPGTLLMTVAKGKGWKAQVDGEPADLLRADTAFMALELPAGTHEIELSYFTPGLMEGLAVTGVGLVALAVLAVVLRVRRNAGGPEGGTSAREFDRR